MGKSDIQGKIEKVKNLLLEHGLIKNDEKDLSKLGFSKEIMVDLFISKTIVYAANDDPFVDKWIKAKLRSVTMHSEIIPIDEIDKWHIDRQTGNICHDSGRFFTITGLKVRHCIKYEEIEWDQPIIDQPEVGILGILAKKIGGVLHLCLQAKEEPGNINSVQLAPTVQATFSNYSQIHGGKLPPFAELFLDPPKEKILVAKLQAEDGGRFLFKSNRNMIILVGGNDIQDLPDEFIWLTLRQIGNLMKRDNLINSCARSVLSCLI